LSPFEKGGIEGGFGGRGWIFHARVPPLFQRGGWGRFKSLLHLPLKKGETTLNPLCARCSPSFQPPNPHRSPSFFKRRVGVDLGGEIPPLSPFEKGEIKSPFVPL